MTYLRFYEANRKLNDFFAASEDESKLYSDFIKYYATIVSLYDELANEDMVATMRELLLPQATIITPNSMEARRLAQDEEDDHHPERHSGEHRGGHCGRHQTSVRAADLGARLAGALAGHAHASHGD